MLISNKKLPRYQISVFLITLRPIAISSGGCRILRCLFKETALIKTFWLLLVSFGWQTLQRQESFALCLATICFLFPEKIIMLHTNGNLATTIFSEIINDKSNLKQKADWLFDALQKGHSSFFPSCTDSRWLKYSWISTWVFLPFVPSANNKYY